MDHCLGAHAGAGRRAADIVAEHRTRLRLLGPAELERLCDECLERVDEYVDPGRHAGDSNYRGIMYIDQDESFDGCGG